MLKKCHPHCNSNCRNRFKALQGQSLTEYLILLALIAVASIGIVQTLGHNIQSRLSVISDRLINKKSQAGGRASRRQDYTLKDLHNFQMTGGGDEND